MVVLCQRLGGAVSGFTTTTHPLMQLPWGYDVSVQKEWTIYLIMSCHPTLELKSDKQSKRDNKALNSGIFDISSAFRLDK